MDANKKGNGTNWLRAETLYKVAYGVVAFLAITSYWSLHSFITAQEPVAERIIVSNLTLNTVLFAVVVGGCVPYVTRKLFPRRFKLMLIPVALAMGMLMLLALRTFGVEMRF